MIKFFHINPVYLNAFFFPLRDDQHIYFPFPHTFSGGRRTSGEA